MILDGEAGHWGERNRLLIDDSTINIAQIRIQMQEYEETLYINNLRLENTVYTLNRV